MESGWVRARGSQHTRAMQASGESATAAAFTPAGPGQLYGLTTATAPSGSPPLPVVCSPTQMLPLVQCKGLHLTQVALPRASQLPPWDHLTALPTSSSGTLCARPHQGIRMRGQDSSRRRTFCMPSWHGPTYSGGGVSVLVSDTLSWLGRSSSRMT